MVDSMLLTFKQRLCGQNPKIVMIVLEWRMQQSSLEPRLRFLVQFMASISGCRGKHPTAGDVHHMILLLGQSTIEEQQSKMAYEPTVDPTRPPATHGIGSGEAGDGDI
ncbi:hypothetical protein ACA910_019723 [Epithemia clementina (nom. ined.)]